MSNDICNLREKNEVLELLLKSKEENQETSKKAKIFNKADGEEDEKGEKKLRSLNQ